MGETNLVLLPGLDGTGHLFHPLLKVLPTYLRPSVVSYPTDKFLDYRGLELYVHKKIPVNEPFVLLAESFSGPLAIELAATRPLNLVALILCATFVANPTPLPADWASLILNAQLFKIHPPQFLVRRFLLGQDVPANLISNFMDALHSVAPKVLSSRVRSILRVNVKDALRECRMPILYLSAKRDKLVSKRCLKEMISINPQIKAVTIDGPHFLLQRKPVEAAAAIDSFLRDQILKGI